MIFFFISLKRSWEEGEREDKYFSNVSSKNGMKVKEFFKVTRISSLGRGRMFSTGNFQRNGYGDREEWSGERGKAERKHGRGRNRETRKGASSGAIGGGEGGGGARRTRVK